MFNVCRRGPASVSRAFSAAVRIPCTRPSTLALSFQKTAKPVSEARWLHLSSLRLQEASTHRREQPKASRDDVEVEKFQELIDYDLVHPNVVNAITKGMGHTTMTQVQSMTINQALRGTDMQVETTSKPKQISDMFNAVLRKPELVPERLLVFSFLSSKISSTKILNWLPDSVTRKPAHLILELSSFHPQENWQSRLEWKRRSYVQTRI